MEISDSTVYTLGGIMTISGIFLVFNKVTNILKSWILGHAAVQTDLKIEESEKETDKKCNKRFGDFSSELRGSIEDMTQTVVIMNDNLNKHILSTAESNGEINTAVQGCSSDIANMKKYLEAVDQRGKKDGETLTRLSIDVARMGSTQ